MAKDTIAVGALFVLVILVVAVFLTFPRHDIPALQQPQSSTSVSGIIESISTTTNSLTVYTEKGLHVAVAIDEKTAIRNKDGAVVDTLALQPGMEVTSIGVAQNSFSMNASSVLIAPGDLNNQPVQPDNVFQDSIIPDTYSITGMALGSWFYQGSFPVIVYDAQGKLINRSHAYAQSEWRVEGLIPFNAWLSFDDPTTATGTIVFERNNPTDAPENAARVSIPVKFATQAGTTPVKLYYPNVRKASELSDVCSTNTLLPVRRNIPKTESPIKDTIETLIKGQISHEEKAQGFTTDFPDKDFKLISSSLADNGTLTLEFTSVPGFTSGGSCRMGLLKEEIRKTALQFSSVKKVIFTPETLFEP